MGNGTQLTSVVGSGGRFGGVDRQRQIIPEANRVAFFLQAQLLRGEQVGQTAEGGPVRLVIRHVVGGKACDRVDSHSIAKPRDVPEEAIPQLALEIYNTAANDAEGRGRGEQRYVLQSYTESAPTEEPYSICFKVAPGRTDQREGGYVDSDPPTEVGLAALLMRKLDRLEDNFAELMEGATAVMSSMRSQIGDQQEELRAIRAERRQDLEMIEKARTEEWRQVREAKETDARIKRDEALVSGVTLIGGAIAKRMALIDPKTPIPADEADMVSIAESLTPEQYAFLMGPQSVFTPYQKLALQDFVQRHVERAEAAKGGNQAQAEEATRAREGAEAAQERAAAAWQAQQAAAAAKTEALIVAQQAASQAATAQTEEALSAVTPKARKRKSKE